MSAASLLQRADEYMRRVAEFENTTQAERTALVLIADLATALRDQKDDDDANE